jgi:hypothetical protein
MRCTLNTLTHAWRLPPPSQVTPLSNTLFFLFFFPLSEVHILFYQIQIISSANRKHAKLMKESVQLKCVQQHQALPLRLVTLRKRSFTELMRCAAPTHNPRLIEQSTKGIPTFPLYHWLQRRFYGTASPSSQGPSKCRQRKRHRI